MKSIILLALLSLTAASAEGQCRPPHDSHEARLLAFTRHRSCSPWRRRRPEWTLAS